MSQDDLSPTDRENLNAKLPDVPSSSTRPDGGTKAEWPDGERSPDVSDARPAGETSGRADDTDGAEATRSRAGDKPDLRDSRRSVASAFGIDEKNLHSREDAELGRAVKSFD